MVYRAAVRSPDNRLSYAIEEPADDLGDAINSLAALAFWGFEKEHPEAASLYTKPGASLSIAFERVGDSPPLDISR